MSARLDLSQAPHFNSAPYLCRPLLRGAKRSWRCIVLPFAAWRSETALDEKCREETNTLSTHLFSRPRFRSRLGLEVILSPSTPL